MILTNWPEGIKKTKQREAIWSVLTDATKPITAIDIAEAISEIGRASCRERVCQYV